MNQYEPGMYVTLKILECYKFCSEGFYRNADCYAYLFFLIRKTRCDYKYSKSSLPNGKWLEINIMQYEKKLINWSPCIFPHLKKVLININNVTDSMLNAF